TRHGPILTSMPRFSNHHPERSEGSLAGQSADPSLPLRMTDSANPADDELLLRMTGSANADGDELPLALRWTGLELHSIVSAVQKMNRASNWEEFRNALREWDTPPQNIIYADGDGNIG